MQRIFDAERVYQSKMQVYVKSWVHCVINMIRLFVIASLRDIQYISTAENVPVDTCCGAVAGAAAGRCGFGSAGMLRPVT